MQSNMRKPHQESLCEACTLGICKNKKKNKKKNKNKKKKSNKVNQTETKN